MLSISLLLIVDWPPAGESALVPDCGRNRMKRNRKKGDGGAAAAVDDLDHWQCIGLCRQDTNTKKIRPEGAGKYIPRGRIQPADGWCSICPLKTWGRSLGALKVTKVANQQTRGSRYPCRAAAAAEVAMLSDDLSAGRPSVAASRCRDRWCKQPSNENPESPTRRRRGIEKPGPADAPAAPHQTKDLGGRPSIRPLTHLPPSFSRQAPCCAAAAAAAADANQRGALVSFFWWTPLKAGPVGAHHPLGALTCAVFSYS